jgi:hypothetical protein
MKKQIFIFTIALMFLIFPTAIFASEQINVNINGQRVDFFAQQPTIVNGRTLVPVRGVFEQLGFDVDENGDTVSVYRDDFNVLITIGSATFVTNGESHTLDVPAQIIGDSTMIPLRRVLESINYSVEWSSVMRTVRITSDVAIFNEKNIHANDISYRIADAVSTLAPSRLNVTDEEFNGQVLEEAVRAYVFYLLIEEFAAENGIVLNAAIAQDMDEIIPEWFDDDEFIKMAHASGFFNLPQVLRYFYLDELTKQVFETIIADEALFAPFADFMEEAPEEDLLGAKHILISSNDFEDEETAMEFAVEIWERALAGEDFVTLVETYGKDPGMAQYPEGYTFTVGAMIDSFENGVLSVEIGEIAAPVTSIHGIHIIKRIEPNLDGEIMRPWGSPHLTLEERKWQAAITAFEEKAVAAEITFLPALYKMPV